MAIEDELRQILAGPAESTRLDFKDLVGWDSRHNQLKLARAVACLANREGGYIVLGVKDLGHGRWAADGLASDDAMPDSTEIGKLLRKHFEPPPRFELFDRLIDGRRFGVIRVEEFDRTPHICATEGVDDEHRTILRRASVYRRTDAMQCSEVDSAEAMRSMIEAAVAKTGSAVKLMMGDTGSSVSQPTPLATGVQPLRVCDLTPRPTPQPRSLLDLVDMVSKAVVRSVGGILVPRSIDPANLPPSAMVREPGRLLIEKTADRVNESGLDESVTTSAVEVSRSLKVRLRETLWESPGTVDVSSLIAYVMSCLLFASRLYSFGGVANVGVVLGLVRPLGLRLVLDSGRFRPFTSAYVATSGMDLVVDRDVALETLADPAARAAAAREICDELFAYFGFRLSEEGFQAQLAFCNGNIPGLLG